MKERSVSARLQDAIKQERQPYPPEGEKETIASKVRRRLLRGEALSQETLEHDYKISATYFKVLRGEMEDAGFIFESETRNHEGIAIPVTKQQFRLTNPGHDVPDGYAPKRNRKTTRKRKAKAGKAGEARKVSTKGEAKPVRRKAVPALTPGEIIQVREVRLNDNDELVISLRNDSGTYQCNVESFVASPSNKGAK